MSAMRRQTSPDDLRRRVEITTAVRDTDRLPKVDDAGAVRDHDGVLVQVMHNGVLIEEGCYFGAFMTEIITRLRGHHEPQEEVVFNELVQRLAADTGAPTMVELGSHWSYYSLWLAHVMPASTNVMVEPDPAHLAVGKRNFALNDRSGRFVHAAIGSEHGGTVWLACESDAVVRKTPVVTLDGLMRDERLDRIDLLLCDIQGAEFELLRGAGRLLAEGRLRFLLISTHHHAISGDPLIHQRCLALLEAAGAHIIAEHTISESCSGDGLIAASMDPRDDGFSVEVSRVRARESLFGELEYDLATAARWQMRLRPLKLAARRGATALNPRRLLGQA